MLLWQMLLFRNSEPFIDSTDSQLPPLAGSSYSYEHLAGAGHPDRYSEHVYLNSLKMEAGSHRRAMVQGRQLATR